MPKMVPEAGPIFKQQQGQEPTSPLPVQPGPLLILMVLQQEARGVPEIRPYLTDSSREDVADSDMDTASRDCITYLDTDKVTIQTAWKKYWKRVQASFRLSKGSLWTEAQLKRIGDSHQAMWVHDHESVQTEQDHALVEDCNSFEMHRMMVRTDQLLCTATAIDSQYLYQRLRGGGPWLGKDSGIVAETIPHPLLLFL